MTTWTRVDAGSSPGNLIADIAVIDASNVVAITSDNKVLRSTDGGATFAEVVGALPGGAAAFDMEAGNGAAVIQGTNAGLAAIFTSTDGGATWNDVTPPGRLAQGSPVLFLPGFGKFITSEGGGTNLIWSSSDGVTWTGTPVVGLAGADVLSFTRQYAAEGAGGAAMMVGFSSTWIVLLGSLDGITWTNWANYGPAAFMVGGTVAWNGNVFNACWLQDGTLYYNEVSLDGFSPAYGNGGAGMAPPETEGQAVLGSDFYTSGSSSNNVGVSIDDGVSWVPYPNAVPDCTFLYGVLGLPPSELLAYEQALVVTDGATWVTELGPLATGFFNRAVTGFALTFAVGQDDAGDGGIWRRDTGIVQVEVPPVVNMTLADGSADIIAATLVVGATSTESSLTVPLGRIIRQSPAGGTLVDSGSSVNLVVSSGFLEVPDIEGDTAAQANAKIIAEGLSVGAPTTGFSDTVPYGSVVSQDPPKGTHVLAGTPVYYAVSVPRLNFDVDRTVISQYANSPTLLQLIHNMDEYIDRGVDLATFYQYVWNVDTAVGFGLDIWGKIVGVSRLLQIPGNDPIVGFDNVDEPKDWQPMSQGRFSRGDTVGQAYLLPDDGYRVLILTKALANIVATTPASINQLLRNLFPNRGRAYVRDLGGMAMQFVFNFSLTPTEYAILTQSGVLPHPAGVFYSVVVVPIGKFFGFRNTGTSVRPFNHGVFNSRL